MQSISDLREECDSTKIGAKSAHSVAGIQRSKLDNRWLICPATLPRAPSLLFDKNALGSG